MSDSMKEAFEDMLKSLNHVYELREAIYKETGYTDEMFDLMNEVMDGEYDTVDEIAARMEEIKDDMERDE